MTATFNPTLSDTVSKVRFHIGDTDVSAPALQDETITALVALNLTIERAVIAALLYLISQVSRPDFRADWLQVQHGNALEGYRRLLAEKRAEFGISALDATLLVVERVD